MGIPAAKQHALFVPFCQPSADHTAGTSVKRGSGPRLEEIEKERRFRVHKEALVPSL